MPDGYTYENTFGGWQMCDRCGARVSDYQLHDLWHFNLNLAINQAAQNVRIFWDSAREKEAK